MVYKAPRYRRYYAINPHPAFRNQSFILRRVCIARSSCTYVQTDLALKQISVNEIPSIAASPIGISCMIVKWRPFQVAGGRVSSSSCRNHQLTLNIQSRSIQSNNFFLFESFKGTVSLKCTQSYRRISLLLKKESISIIFTQSVHLTHCSLKLTIFFQVYLLRYRLPH